MTLPGTVNGGCNSEWKYRAIATVSPRFALYISIDSALHRNVILYDGDGKQLDRFGIIEGELLVSQVHGAPKERRKPKICILVVLITADNDGVRDR